MKNIALKFLAIAFVITAFIACSKDEVTPTPKVCDTGYSGTNCDVPFNFLYTGNGTLTENCSSSGTGGYNVTFTKSTTNPLQFTIGGLWEVPAASTLCIISITNSNQFSATRQPIMAGFDIEILTGTLNGNTVTYTYRIYPTGSNTVSDSCSGTIQKS